ncbi:MAG: hypothetical protein ACK5TH_13580, partial [Prosthecobacter sp.]
RTSATSIDSPSVGGGEATAKLHGEVNLDTSSAAAVTEAYSVSTNSIPPTSCGDLGCRWR